MHPGGIKVYKVLSVVKNCIYIILVLFCFNSLAEETRSNTYLDKAFDKCDKEGGSLDKCLETVQNATGSGNSCETQSAAMSKALSEFSSNCSSSGFSSESGKCISEARKCQECTGKDSDDGSCSPDGDDDDDYEDDDYGNGFNVAEAIEEAMANGQMTPQLKIQKNKMDSKNEYRQEKREATTLYKLCPVMAAEDLKDYREDVKEGKKEKSEKQSEVQEAEKELQEAMNETQDAIIEAQQKLEDAQQEAQETLQSMQEEAQNEEQKMKDEIQKGRDTIIQLGDQLKATTSEMKEVYIGHLQEIAKIEEECILKAQQNLEKIRDNKRQLIAQKKYSARGFNSLLKSSSLSSFQQSERTMDRLVRNCQRGRSYQNKLRIAKQAYKLALKKIDQKIEILKRNQQRLHEQIMQIISQMPQKQQQFQMKMQQYQQKSMQQLSRLQQQLQLLQTRGQQNQQMMQQKLVRLKSELEDVEDYLSHKQSMLNLKEKHKPKYPSSNEDKVNTLAKYEDVKNAISLAASSCRCCASGKGSLNCTTILGHANRFGVDSITQTASCGGTAPIAPLMTTTPGGR